MDEGISISLNWPAAVAVAVVLSIIVFRKELGALISRIKRVGRSGLETFDSAAPPPAQAERKGIEEFIRSFDNPLLVEAEEAVRKDLADRKIEAPADRERALVRALAATNLIRAFDQVAASIWASQLLLLRFANEQAIGVKLENARLVYDDAKKKFPRWYERYSFENWLGYLESNTLLRREGDMLHITVAGREFLKYHIHSGRPSPSYG